MKRVELINTLKKVLPGVEDKSIIEGANSFFFDEKWVKTFNDSIAVSYPFETGLKCSVKAQEFFKVVSKIESEDVRMVLLEDGRLQLSAGKTVVKMASMEADTILKAVDNLSLLCLKWETLPKDFLRMVRFASKYSSSRIAL